MSVEVFFQKLTFLASSFTSKWLFFSQAYLAFYVINDLCMAQSAKALVGVKLFNVII